MITRIKLPTEDEIATNRRLRQACDTMTAINSQSPAFSTDERNYLPPATVDAMRLLEQSLEPGDLMAIRQQPFLWARPACPDVTGKWLWILHRYLNRYA